MKYGLELSALQSYLIYFCSIFLATLFAYYSDKYAKLDKKMNYRVNKFFWALSFLMLFIPLAFRGYGVDHQNYLNVYNRIKSSGANFYTDYTGMPEPLYALLNYIVVNTIDNFQYVYIISSFISLFFLYLNFSRYVKKVDLVMLIWSFGFTFYFFMFGLVRISIAVGISTYAYKFLESKQFKKYLICCVLASLFHYSAIIMIPIYFLVNIIKKNEEGISLLKYGLIVCLFIPLIFMLIRILFPIIFGRFYWFQRYNIYFNAEINWRAVNNVAFVLPLLIIIIFWKKHIAYNIINSTLYIKLFFIMIGFIIGSISFPIHRITYYLYPACCYLYASVSKLSFKQVQRKGSVILYSSCMIIFGLLWIIVSIFNNILWEPFLVPYYFNLL